MKECLKPRKIRGREGGCHPLGHNGSSLLSVFILTSELPLLGIPSDHHNKRNLVLSRVAAAPSVSTRNGEDEACPAL